jgi:chromosome segregation ATPase
MNLEGKQKMVAYGAIGLVGIFLIIVLTRVLFGHDEPETPDVKALLTQVGERVETLEAEKYEMAEQVGELMEELAKLKDIKVPEELDDQIHSLKSIVGSLEEENLRVQSEEDQIKVLHTANEDLTAQVASLIQEKEALEHEMANLKAETTEAKGLTKENRRLNRRIKALEKERAAFDKKMKGLESEADVNGELAKENKELRIEVQTLQKEIEGLNVRFEEIIKMAADDLKAAAKEKGHKKKKH